MRAKGSKKTGGRSAGTPNRVTANLKAWVYELLDKNKDQIADDLKELEPHQRVAIFEKLLSYAVPKQQAVSAQIDLNRLSDEQLNTVINELTNNLRDE